MDQAKERESAIAASDFFGGLTEECCRELARVCRPRALAKRDTFFLEGARGDSMFLLLQGAVQLTKAAPDGNSIVIRTVKPGEAFAEVVLFEQEQYPVTATALVASRALSFARRDIRRLLDQPGFRDDFLAYLMRRLRFLAARIGYLSSYDAEERFFQFLRDQYGEERRIRVHIPKKDVAAAIGTTPETFSRLTQRLKRERKIRWEGKCIEVLRWPEL